MTEDLTSSSEHRDQGILSPNQRLKLLESIFYYLAPARHPSKAEASAMQDLCFHLYSQSVAERMAASLNISVPKLRKALDVGIKAVKDCEGVAPLAIDSNNEPEP